jgi:hypothetical protein
MAFKIMKLIASNEAAGFSLFWLNADTAICARVAPSPARSPMDWRMVSDLPKLSRAVG